MEEKCNTLPPKEIYDVLHEFESLGGNIPKSVDWWWIEETVINSKRSCSAS